MINKLNINIRTVSSPKAIKEAANVEDGNGQWFKSFKALRLSYQLEVREMDPGDRNLCTIDRVPDLLHSISIIRMLRSANFLINVALTVYGFLYKLLTFPEDRVSRLKTDYQLHSFLIDYGMCCLVVFEVALSAKLFNAMFRYQKVMRTIKLGMINNQDCKTYINLSQEFKGHTLLSNVASGITCLRQEVQALNRN